MTANNSNKTFYITAPIFYPNGELHIGHAYTMIVCDIFARYHKQLGDKTYFLAGSDENSSKIEKEAEKRGEKDVMKFLDNMSESFKTLYKDIQADYDQFIRTSDQKKHWPGATKIWNTLTASGDIYEGAYKGLYCPGCEAFVTEKDLVNGLCQYHNIPPEKIEEKNYFFKLSKYAPIIKQKIESDELQILPKERKNEILSLINQGLEDVSFSRPKAKVGRGVPVPGDAEQIMYVWGDALVNYISALGYGSDDESLFKTFWPANIHVVGKDILRFHCAIWIGMLLSAGLELPKTVLAHGLLMSGGRKMSKSLGNAISPEEAISLFGAEGLRYYFARHATLFDDAEMTLDLVRDAYNASLTNGIGNLTNRILKMSETNVTEPVTNHSDELPQEFQDAMNAYDLNRAANFAWKEVNDMDLLIQTTEPFKLVKVDKEKAVQIIKDLTVRLHTVACMIESILPDASAKIKVAIKENKKPETPLFDRK